MDTLEPDLAELTFGFLKQAGIADVKQLDAATISAIKNKAAAEHMELRHQNGLLILRKFESDDFQARLIWALNYILLETLGLSADYRFIVTRGDPKDMAMSPAGGHVYWTFKLGTEEQSVMLIRPMGHQWVQENSDILSAVTKALSQLKTLFGDITCVTTLFNDQESPSPLR